VVHCHPNALLTPRGRAEVFAAVEAGMTVVAACLAFNIVSPGWSAGRNLAGCGARMPPGSSGLDPRRPDQLVDDRARRWVEVAIQVVQWLVALSGGEIGLDS